MQKGDRAIELHLSLFRTTDGKVNRAQGMAGVMLEPACLFLRAFRRQSDQQADSEAQEGTKERVFH